MAHSLTLAHCVAPMRGMHPICVVDPGLRRDEAISIATPLDVGVTHCLVLAPALLTESDASRAVPVMVPLPIT